MFVQLLKNVRAVQLTQFNFAKQPGVASEVPSSIWTRNWQEVAGQGA